MKKLINSIGLILLSLFAFSQTYDVTVSGIVTDDYTGSPVSNQAINIMTDSMAGGNTAYYNTVYTDITGLYSDSFTVPVDELGIVEVYTFSCGIVMSNNGNYSIDNPQLTFDFQVCEDTIGDCQAMFYYYATDPNSIQYTDESYGEPDSWTWEFGDGVTSTEQHPLHTYTDFGSYMVTLTIENSLTQCTSTFQQNVYVNDSVWPGECSAMWWAYQDSTEYLTYNFNDMSVTANGQIDNWYWDFGDGNTSMQQNPIHTYSVEGYYQVCLTIVDSLGQCEDTFCDLVQVGNWQPECEAMYYYYPIDSSNNGGWNMNNIQFTDMSFGEPDTWYWEFGDGQTSVEQNPIHYFSEEGYYEVCLTISSTTDSCSSIFCDNIEIYNDTMTGCFSWYEYEINDLTVDFEAFIEGGSNSTEFIWDFADGTTGNGQTTSHTFATAGMYNVTLTTMDSAGCYSIFQEMLFVGEITFDVSGYVYLEDSNMMADYADVQLMTFDTLSNGLINLETTQLDANGYYQFSGVGLENCIYFVQAELTDQSAYVGQYVPTYHFDAINWEMAWPIFPFTGGWSYDIMMVNASSANTGNGLIMGTVANVGTRDLLPNVEILLLNQENEPVFYSKTDESGNFDFSELEYGTYTVYTEIVGITTIPFEVTLSEEENSVEVNIVVRNGEAVLGINEPQSAYIESVNNIFPNPVTSNANLTVNMKENSSIQVDVYNQYGQLVYELNTNLTTGKHELLLELGTLSDGMYIIKVSADDSIGTVKKFIKMR